MPLCPAKTAEVELASSRQPMEKGAGIEPLLSPRMLPQMQHTQQYETRRLRGLRDLDTVSIKPSIGDSTPIESSFIRVDV